MSLAATGALGLLATDAAVPPAAATLRGFVRSTSLEFPDLALRPFDVRVIGQISRLEPAQFGSLLGQQLRHRDDFVLVVARRNALDHPAPERLIAAGRRLGDDALEDGKLIALARYRVFVGLNLRLRDLQHLHVGLLLVRQLAGVEELEGFDSLLRLLKAAPGILELRLQELARRIGERRAVLHVLVHEHARQTIGDLHGVRGCGDS